MRGDLDKIMETVLEMREYVANSRNINEILEKFKDFREECPKLFELVLENKHGYFEELQDMVKHANLVKNGTASLSDVTKVVKNKYDNKYIYPKITGNLTEKQKEETEDFAAREKKKADQLKQNWYDVYD